MQFYWVEQRLSDVPQDHDWLSPIERAHLQHLHVPKRRSDWRLGRWTAKRAVTAYLEWTDKQLNQVEIRSLPNGAPRVLLPGGSSPPSISISHSNGVCMCVVGPAGAPIGCDLEQVEPRDEWFLQTFFTEDEIDAVASLPRDQRSILVNVIWSAKESCLKYTQEGLTRDTRDVQVTVPILARKGSLTVIPSGWFPLLTSIEKNEIEGQARLRDDLVVTIAGTESMPISLSTPRLLAIMCAL